MKQNAISSWCQKFAQISKEKQEHFLELIAETLILFQKFMHIMIFDRIQVDQFTFPKIISLIFLRIFDMKIETNGMEQIVLTDFQKLINGLIKKWDLFSYLPKKTPTPKSPPNLTDQQIMDMIMKSYVES